MPAALRLPVKLGHGGLPDAVVMPRSVAAPRSVAVPGAPAFRLPRPIRLPGTIRRLPEPPLGSVIAATHARAGRRDLDRDIFGTYEPGRIASIVDRFCVFSLGAGIERYRFFATSVHSVHGVELADGRRVVIKVARPSAGAEACFAAVQTVQFHLAASGFPCPRPVLEATEMHGGVAVVEQMLDRGAPANGHRPWIRREMAAVLAKQVDLCRGFVGLSGLGAPLVATPRAGQLWPGAQDHTFASAARARGTQWIDELAGAARATLAAADDDVVVAHSDWRSEHVRFKRAKIVATFDWESLAIGPEAAMLGQIAHTLTIDFGIKQKRRMPTLQDFRAFVDTYESARGRDFTPAQRKTIDAAWVYSTAYNARSQNAGESVPNPKRAYAGEDSFRGMLARYGELLLA
jgi:hypothetical protein